MRNPRRISALKPSVQLWVPLLLVIACNNSLDAVSDFEALSLDHAIRIAIERNHAFRNQRDSVQFSQLAQQQARSSYDWEVAPFASFNQEGGHTSQRKSANYGLLLSKTLTRGSRIQIQSSVDHFDEGHSSSASIMLSQPLVQLFSSTISRDLLDSADYNTQSALRGFLLDREYLVISVIQAYLRLQEAQGTLRVRKNSFSQLTNNLLLVRSKEKLGILDAIDVHRAEMSAQSAENALLGAEESLTNALLSFKSLLGIEFETPVSINSDPLNSRFSIPAEDAVILALENRIELIQAKHRWKEQQRRAKVQEAKLLPDLSIEVGYQLREPFDGATNEGNWVIGVSGSTDLRKKRERIALQQAYIQSNQALRLIQQTEDQIKSEVTSQWSDHQKNIQQLEIQTSLVRSSEGRLKLANLKFSNNRGSNFDVVEAEQEWIRSRLDLIRSRNNLTLSAYLMMKTTGTLFQLGIDPASYADPVLE